MDSGSVVARGISKSLAQQLRQYRLEQDLPVVLYGFESYEKEHVGFGRYDEKGLNNLRDIIPLGLVITGVLYFESFSKKKMPGVIQKLHENVEIVDKNGQKIVLECVQYDFDEDEFYQINLDSGKKVEIEIPEIDGDILSYFLLAGSMKFHPGVSVQDQLAFALRNVLFFQLVDEGEVYAMTRPEGTSITTFKKVSTTPSSIQEVMKIVKSQKQYLVDSSGITPISQLPRFIIETILDEDDKTLESQHQTVELSDFSQNIIDFTFFVSAEEFQSNPDSVLTRLSKELERRSLSPFRRLVAFPNSSIPFYTPQNTEVPADNDFSFNQKSYYVKDPSVLTSSRTTLHRNKLRNVHLSLLKTYRSDAFEMRSVTGDFIYFHYNQDNFNDDGWGCAYRSFQTIYSWMLLQGFTTFDVPSIPEIQEALYQMGAKDKRILNSRNWIGSVEVGNALQKFANVDFKIISISSGAQVLSKVEEFKSHFENFGTPIMIGGGVLAYTMLGIAVNDDKIQDTQFLILDPHYKGDEDWKKITNTKKGGVWWRTCKLFNTKDFYNFCCPIPNFN